MLRAWHNIGVPPTAPGTDAPRTAPLGGDDPHGRTQVVTPTHAAEALLQTLWGVVRPYQHCVPLFEVAEEDHREFVGWMDDLPTSAQDPDARM